MAVRQQVLDEAQPEVSAPPQVLLLVNLPDEAVYTPPAESKFHESRGPVDYFDAPDLHVIASRLIRRWPELESLGSLEIGYLWRRKGGENKGQAVLGKCTSTSGLVAHYSGADYVIWVAADHAREHALTRRQVEAILHHELLHAGISGLQGHDFEGFALNVQRYGAWLAGLKVAESAFEQLRLEDPEAG